MNVPFSFSGFPWKFHSSCDLGRAVTREPACHCRRHKRCGLSPGAGKILWRRERQPTPVFLPEKSHGQRSLTGYSSWGPKGSQKLQFQNMSMNFLIPFPSKDGASSPFPCLWAKHSDLPLMTEYGRSDVALLRLGHRRHWSFRLAVSGIDCSPGGKLAVML